MLDWCTPPVDLLLLLAFVMMLHLTSSAVWTGTLSNSLLTSSAMRETGVMGAPWHRASSTRAAVSGRTGRRSCSAGGCT